MEAFAAASTVVRSMLSGGSPTAPAPEAPKTMPTMDSAAILDAKRKSVAAQQARGGRASTFLSGGSSVLSGGAGLSDKLGA